jgi:hypothetical protein
MLRFTIIPFAIKIRRLFLILIFGLLSEFSCAQATTDTVIEHFVVYNDHVVYKPFAITGRVIGANLESIKGAEVVNICSGKTTRADDNGIFHFEAAKGDSLAFAGSKYSATVVGVRSAKDKFNIILIKRKTGGLPHEHSRSDYDKAKKDDDELYKILDKDAKEEGKWNY